MNGRTLRRFGQPETLPIGMVSIRIGKHAMKVGVKTTQGQIGARSEVTGFSDSSRKRLFDWLNSIDWDRAGLPLFLTLTYGQDWPSAVLCKRHLDSFFKCLSRRFPGVGALWRMEPQKRGAPHFHLLVFGTDRIDKDWLRSTWGQVIGRQFWDTSKCGQVPKGDALDLSGARLPRTKVERLRSLHGVKWYVGKYIAKREPGDKQEEAAASAGDEEASASPVLVSTSYFTANGDPWTWTGRHWGVMGRRFVPRCEYETFMVAPIGGWLFLLRQIACLEGWKGLNLAVEHAGEGFTLYFNDDKDSDAWTIDVRAVLKAYSELLEEGVTAVRGFDSEGFRADWSGQPEAFGKLMARADKIRAEMLRKRIAELERIENEERASA